MIGWLVALWAFLGGLLLASVVERGLVREDILRAVDLAMVRHNVPAQDTFRYMAGICWSMLRQREQMAALRIARSGD